MELTVHLPEPHTRQMEFLRSPKPRKVIRAGRRGGKTVGISIKAVEAFLAGRRVLYAAPTNDQVDTFWRHVCRALQEPIDRKLYYKNETEHVIELLRTEQRIKAKTAWNAETLRGDYADLLILDEFQLMNEDAWGVVGAPMLLDNNGDAVFIYTPPSVRTAGLSKARDKRHAAKMFKAAQADTSGRWGAFSFSSHDNPYLDQTALREITGDMTNLAYRQEIMAEDIEEIPGALWSYSMLDAHRVTDVPPLMRIVVGVDPKASVEADSETGIVVAGLSAEGHVYILGDYSVDASPEQWARRVAYAYEAHSADRIVAEVNQGGDMVVSVLRATGIHLSITQVRATRGKFVRAEPVAALYEQGKAHHVGTFGDLEGQLTSWVPGDKSPDRLDALVWACTALREGGPAVMGPDIWG